MGQVTVIYDACVLYPATLRSFLVYLAGENVFLARWTDRIHDEWTRNVLANHPDIRPEQLGRTRALMDAHVPHALVTGYEPLIQTLELPDPDDRHVFAAAIVARAGVIVTANVADFPAAALAPFGVVARKPDVFVEGIVHAAPAAVARAFVNQRRGMRRPPRTADELLDELIRNGLTATAAALRPFAAEL